MPVKVPSTSLTYHFNDSILGSFNEPKGMKMQHKVFKVFGFLENFAMSSYKVWHMIANFVGSYHE